MDDRKFLLGLDELYRSAVRVHERGELLECVRALCSALGKVPADVPVEGYYSEEPELAEYFRRMRALQVVEAGAEPLVDSMPAFARLKAVTTSPIYGAPGSGMFLFPSSKDPLSRALLELPLEQWRVSDLTAKARDIVRASEDFSLVDLASFIGDAVVLAALRETAVLYDMPVASGIREPVEITYEWRVDPALAERAQRFVSTFNELFDESLPSPEPEEVKAYWEAACDSFIFGRCVRIGYDDRATPIRHYHWGICSDSAGQESVHEFWYPEIWTTERFRDGVLSRKPLP